MLAGGEELERALFYLDVEGIGVDAAEFRSLHIRRHTVDGCIFITCVPAMSFSSVGINKESITLQSFT
jgi:hypothetical protein